MELLEIKSMWQTYDAKLEKLLKLNVHCLGLIQAQKVRSQLTPMLWQRGIELAFHVIAIVLLLGFLANNLSDWRYAASALALLVFYVLASSNCIRQIIIIKRMDYSNDIVTIQSSLLMLRTHVMNLARLALLCIPTFLAYPMVVSKAIADLNLQGLSFMDIRSGYHGDWWSIQLLVSIILIPGCIWLYQKLSYKNIHISWVKNTIVKFSGTRIARAIELTNELESLKRDVC